MIEIQNAIDELLKFVALQAEDEGLWCEAESASEAYIQQGLRACHAMIEQELGIGLQNNKS